MKKSFLIAKLILLFSFCISISSCKKDRISSSFNINNPKGYAIVMTKNFDYPVPVIAVFNDGNKLTYAGHQTYGSSSFKVSNNEMILDDDGEELRFTIQNDKIISHSNNLKTAVLIKVPEENQLLGKTFTGSYYNTNGSVLHPKFFYTFDSFTNNVNAGYELGNTVRTETYTPFGNVAAFIQHNGIEFIIKMPDGSVISNYRNVNSTSYGIFK
jgi:hypothetical protein